MIKKCLRKLLTSRNMMILWMLGFFASLIIQTLLQSWFAKQSYWGANHGWQNEIAIWNLGMLAVLTGILRSNKGVEAQILPGLALLSLCFGVNHALALSSSPDSLGNWAGATMNGLAVILYALHRLINANPDNTGQQPV